MLFSVYFHPKIFCEKQIKLDNIISLLDDIKVNGILFIKTEKEKFKRDLVEIIMKMNTDTVEKKFLQEKVNEFIRDHYAKRVLDLEGEIPASKIQPDLHICQSKAEKNKKNKTTSKTEFITIDEYLLNCSIYKKSKKYGYQLDLLHHLRNKTSINDINKRVVDLLKYSKDIRIIDHYLYDIKKLPKGQLHNRIIGVWFFIEPWIKNTIRKKGITVTIFTDSDQTNKNKGTLLLFDEISKKITQLKNNTSLNCGTVKLQIKIIDDMKNCLPERLLSVDPAIIIKIDHEIKSIGMHQGLRNNQKFCAKWKNNPGILSEAKLTIDAEPSNTNSRIDEFISTENLYEKRF